MYVLKLNSENFLFPFRFLLVPNAEHTQITGVLELLPAVTTWARELLLSNSKLDEISYPYQTIEERNFRQFTINHKITLL